MLTESGELSCYTTSTLPVTWEKRTGATSMKIYSTSSKQLADDLKKQGRHLVSDDGGFYNLTIQQLNLGDTADYVCIEYMPSGGFEVPSESTVRLNVEGKFYY